MSTESDQRTRSESPGTTRFDAIGSRRFTRLAARQLPSASRDRSDREGTTKHRVLVAAVGLTATAALALTGCNSRQSTRAALAANVPTTIGTVPVTAPANYTMNVTVNDNDCLNNSVRAAYDGVPVGTPPNDNNPPASFSQVVVKDSTAAIIGTGSPTDKSTCVFTVTVPGLPESSFYSIAVGAGAPLVVSFADAQNENWQISTTLGTVKPLSVLSQG